MNIFYVILIFTMITFSVNSQTKKQQIFTLTKQLDSLKQIINLREIDILKKNETIKDLNNSVSDLNFKLSKINSLNDVNQRNIEILEEKIKDLNNNVSDLNFKLSKSESLNDVNQKNIEILEEKIIRFEDSILKLNNNTPKKFIFPYKHGKEIILDDINYSTFYIDSKKELIITDSLNVRFNKNEILHFYFYTPNTENLSIHCPSEFGYIVFNDEGDKIFQIFDDSHEFENSFSNYIEFDLKSKKRRLLGLESSGCGSGGALTYYELEYINGELIQTPKIHASTGGFETTYFLPEEEKYVELIRINPEAHWSGDTRYKLIFYDLNNDKKIATKETKYIYEHFGEIETSLIDSIKKREPNIFKF